MIWFLCGCCWICLCESSWWCSSCRSGSRFEEDVTNGCCHGTVLEGEFERNSLIRFGPLRCFVDRFRSIDLGRSLMQKSCCSYFVQVELFFQLSLLLQLPPEQVFPHSPCLSREQHQTQNSSLHRPVTIPCFLRGTIKPFEHWDFHRNRWISSLFPERRYPLTCRGKPTLSCLL